MEKVIVGLIKGRHDMPVEEYIFEEINDVFDFGKMDVTIDTFLQTKVGIEQKYDIPINGWEGTDYVFAGQKELVV